MIFFSKKKKSIQEEWLIKGQKYASAINKMVAFAEKNGWENWEGSEPLDKREHLADEVIALLRKANTEGTVAEFRAQFPPAHAPIIKYLEKLSQSIQQLHFIDNQKIVFVTGTSYQKRQAYLLTDDIVLELDSKITAIGKSKKGNIFAIATKGKITLFENWEGGILNEFVLNETATYGITDLIPFNDGSKVLLVSSDGIYLISKEDEKLIHPDPEDFDEEDEEWTANIDMENATLSYDNQFIVVGDQCFDHRILDSNGEKVGSIGPQSSYPHFCLFSKHDNQLITNSCHFYNGITIGVDAHKLNSIAIEAYTDSPDFTVIDEEMRVYVGLAATDYYILGDAYGYIKAIDQKGNKLWSHFLGSTISGMTLSDDEQTLWVGSSSGILHKLQLDKGLRDDHTIGNSNHYEEFRLLIWKKEPQILKW